MKKFLLICSIAQTLELNYPGAQWVVRGNSYEGMDWVSTDIPKPSEKEVLDAQNACADPEKPTLDERIDALETKLEEVK